MALWDALSRRGARGSLHAHNGQSFDRYGWDDVLSRAEGMAAGLRAAGVRPGVTVPSVLTNSVDVVSGLFAVWMAGGALASLPVPTRGMTPAEYGRQLVTLTGRLDAPLLMVEERFAGLVPDEVRSALPVRSWESLRGEGTVEASPPGEDEVAFIQYSSGSTSVPKGCALTPRAIAAQLAIILDMAGGRPGEETVACWLPLSHDMGVFGCLLYSWAHDFDLVLSTPERFMFSPRTWFRDMATYGATMTAGTSTALHLATRAQRDALDGPLRLKVCVVGAERVEWDVLDRAAEVFAPYGLRRSAFMPAYGLAEATLAVSACGWDAEPGYLTVDGYQLADGRVVETGPDDPFATRIVSCGRPCRGVEVTAGDDPDRLGEIRIASPSLASGYHGDPERTAERFVDGRLRTGDLGFVRDGELYVVGRSDDVISVGGRNVYAREIESAIGDLDLVRKGCAVVVDVPGPGRGDLVLFVELRRQLDDYHDFAAAAATVALQKAGVALSHCLFLEKGALPKTPSGKIQRFRCRQLLLEDRFTPLARVTLAP